MRFLESKKMTKNLIQKVLQIAIFISFINMGKIDKVINL